MGTRRRAKQDRRERRTRRYFRRKPRHTLPAVTGMCPSCLVEVKDVYRHVMTAHADEGWRPIL